MRSFERQKRDYGREMFCEERLRSWKGYFRKLYFLNPVGIFIIGYWVSLFLKKKKKESNTFQEEETVRVRDLELGLRMEF